MANRCFLGLSKVEMVDHLLLHHAKDSGSVKFSFLPFWFGLDTLLFSEGNSSWVARGVCGGKLVKRLGKWSPYVYFG